MRSSSTPAWVRESMGERPPAWMERRGFSHCLRSRYEPQTAQQGARANVHIGHVSCCRFFFRIEALDRAFEPSTSHARCGRGSSLTLAKKYPMQSNAKIHVGYI